MKLDDELYDYWDTNYRTHEDYECTEKMEDAIDDVFGSLRRDFLSTKDKKLFEEFAPKLFNVLPEEYELSAAIGGLLKEVLHYKAVKGAGSANSMSYKSETEKTKNKSYEQRIKLLRKSAQSILNLIDTRVHKGLVQELERIIEKPPSYFPKSANGFFSVNKNAIRDYLFSLKLPSKTKIIEGFIIELD